MILRSLRRKQIKITSQVISIIGSCEACGATHLALALGNYLANVTARKVAIISLPPRDSIGFLQENGQKVKGTGWIYNRIYMHNNVDAVKLNEIFNKDYEVIILDIGTNVDKYWDEFVRGQLSIVVCDLSPWKWQGALRIASRLEGVNFKKVVYLNTFGGSLGQKYLWKYHKVRSRTIPFEPDPLRISSQHFEFYNEILKEIR